MRDLRDNPGIPGMEFPGVPNLPFNPSFPPTAAPGNKPELYEVSAARERPEMSENVRKYSDISEDDRKFPRIPGNFREYPEMSEDVRKWLEISEDNREWSEMPGSFRKWPEMSANGRK